MFVNDLLIENGFDLDECLQVSIVTDEAPNMNEIGIFFILKFIIFICF